MFHLRISLPATLLDRAGNPESFLMLRDEIVRSRGSFRFRPREKLLRFPQHRRDDRTRFFKATIQGEIGIFFRRGSLLLHDAPAQAVVRIRLRRRARKNAASKIELLFASESFAEIKQLLGVGRFAAQDSFRFFDRVRHSAPPSVLAANKKSRKSRRTCGFE